MCSTGETSFLGSPEERFYVILHIWHCAYFNWPVLGVLLLNTLLLLLNFEKDFEFIELCVKPQETFSVACSLVLMELGKTITALSTQKGQYCFRDLDDAVLKPQLHVAPHSAWKSWSWAHSLQGNKFYSRLALSSIFPSTSLRAFNEIGLVIMPAMPCLRHWSRVPSSALAVSATIIGRSSGGRSVWMCCATV